MRRNLVFGELPDKLSSRWLPREFSRFLGYTGSEYIMAQEKETIRLVTRNELKYSLCCSREEKCAP